jgi:UDP-N-acetylmuramoylalanine--D-glutamate ligase
MAAPVLSRREPRLAGLRVLVVGLGRSGLAALRLLVAKGARVTAADRRTETDLGRTAEEATGLGAELSTGGHPPELACDADLIVVSPGVPAEEPLLASARELGVPVWGEVELAYRFCHGRIVAVTGSNGKSTTTSMIGAIFRQAGIPGGTGGNLGTPFADLLQLDSPQAIHAIELSSFQLETVDAFRADVAEVLNLSPDHLDRYPTYDAYVAAKARLLEGQNAAGRAVLSADDSESERLLRSVRGGLLRFSTRREVEEGAFLRRGMLVLRLQGKEEEILPAAELRVAGEHNTANALAAALACRLEGCRPDAIARALCAFAALPHRLQHVGTLDGVRFYDDSKATNLDAAKRALAAFPPGTVLLILGGKDKGADWPSLARSVLEQARCVLLVGQATRAIREGLAGTVPLMECGTVPKAVRAGYERARPGDVVLLAPGCASFDQYRNFEERGDDFRRAVEALLPGGGRDA